MVGYILCLKVEMPEMESKSVLNVGVERWTTSSAPPDNWNGYIDVLERR